MKMFGLLSQNHLSAAAPAPSASSAPSARASAPSVRSGQFNMASIMKMQSTGCKSCSRG
jgi:hypothetical protein